MARYRDDEDDRDDDEEYRRRYRTRRRDDDRDDDEYDRRRSWREREEEARGRTVGPGIGLIVAGLLGVIGGFALIGLALSIPMPPPPPVPPGQNANAFNAGYNVGFYGSYICPAVVGLVLGILLLVGGNSLRNCRARGLAMTGCIVGLIPCHVGVIVSLPCAIWGLTVLNDPDVRRAFGYGR